MPENSNRRQFERRPLTEKIYGYLDGQRFDVSSENISEGGLFLSLADPASVPIGTRLALVFRREAALRDRIFLVARVVRRQDSPPGVGLAWIRAVAGGTPGELAAFLAGLLGLPVDRVLSSTQREADGTRVAYHFSASADVMATVLPAEITARASFDAPQGLDPPPPPADADAPDDAGPVTQQIAVDAIRAPARLHAALRTPSKTVSGTIVALGTRGMVIEIASILTGPFERLDVGFVIVAEGRERPMKARARLIAIEPLDRPGAVALDLALDAIDEGADPGLVQRYVRWLHHRSVTAG